MSNSSTNNSGGASGGGGASDNSATGAVHKPNYTEEQRADRAALVSALTDQKTIETMQRWGDSSKERRRKKEEKKCTQSTYLAEPTNANFA
jgi:hypothetical protein